MESALRTCPACLPWRLLEMIVPSHRLRSRTTRLLTASLILVGLAGLEGMSSAQSVPVPNGAERAPTRSMQTVAVLPFANISRQPDDDWIGIGISETVAADVARMGGVSVVAREALLEALNSTRQDASRVLSDETLARDVARDLGAAWIVTGGYQRLGDQLRITVRLVDVETGAIRETAKVDGRFDEIFALQDRIVPQLGDSLASLSGGDAPRVTLARRPAVNQQNGGEEEGTTEPTVASSRLQPDRDRRAGRRSGNDTTVNGEAPPDVASGGITIGGRRPEPACWLVGSQCDRSGPKHHRRSMDCSTTRYGRTPR